MTTDPDITPRRPDAPTLELDHATIAPDGEPGECAIFPTASSDLDPHTNWIVAHGDGFVDLGTMR